MGDSREAMQQMLETVRQSVRRRAQTDAGDVGSGATLGSTVSSRKNRGSGAASPGAGGNTTLLNAKNNTAEFVRYYVEIIRRFIADKTKYELDMPALNGFDRLVVHAIAEKCNLSHISSGVGERRQLRLKKDKLFFEHQDAVNSINVEEIVARVGSKESKFHIRRVPTKKYNTTETSRAGGYGDEEAYEKIQRLNRATDEYLYATDMGYTNEDVLASIAEGDWGGSERDAGEEGQTKVNGAKATTIQDRLRFAGQASSVPEKKSEAAQSPTQGRDGVWSKRNAPSNPDEVSYVEVCRSCSSRGPVDYSIRQWRPEKFCAVCSRSTVWRLEEQVRLHSTEPAKGEQVRKRLHDALDVAPFVGSKQEEIDTLEEEEEELLLLEDAMDLVAMNDYTTEDTNWLREFATAALSWVQKHYHSSGGSAGLQNFLVFCIDFQDVLHLPIFRRYERLAVQHQGDGENEAGKRSRVEGEDVGGAPTTRPRTTSSLPVYAVVRENKAIHKSLHQLLEEVMRTAFSLEAGESPTSLAGHVALALANVSVYGVEATVLCQLRPSVVASPGPRREDGGSPVFLEISPGQFAREVNEAGLLELQKVYGGDHMFVTGNLTEAVRKADAEK